MRVVSILQCGSYRFMSCYNKRSTSIVHSSCPVVSRSESELREISCSRAMKMVRNIFYSNHFDYFVTLTVSPRSVSDRTVYSFVKEKLTYAMNELKKRCPSMTYLLVPDYHADGAFHFHGFFSIAPSDRDVLHRAGSFRLFNSGARAPKFYSPLLNRLLGRNDFRPLMSFLGQKSLSYVLKYVRKASKTVQCQGLPMYVRSRNLLGYTSRRLYEGLDASILESCAINMGLKRFDYDYDVSCFPYLSDEDFDRLECLYFEELFASFPLADISVRSVSSGVQCSLFDS